MKIQSLFTSYIHRSLKRSALLPVLLLLACFALSPQARAVCQQGCDLTNGNTFLGDDALVNNELGGGNTAIGETALYSNVTGYRNTAIGASALYSNLQGHHNTAIGVDALSNNTNSTNTAIGESALAFNSTGYGNTATGHNALFNNVTGATNTAIGNSALYRNTGSSNVALGKNAGFQLTTGSGNVCLGAFVLGNAGESNTTRIRNVYDSVASGRAVYVNPDNKIGTLVSSRRFKQEIKPMDNASDAILALEPVTFRYKKEIDADRTPQFGLVAEEVEKVNPDLVTRDEQGKPYTVRYEAVNAMLLNEFLKEHKAFVAEERKVQEQGATIARLQKQIEALTSGLQKVSAQLELSKPRPRTVQNSQ